MYALATVGGRSAVAIIRISGSESATVLQILTGKSDFTPRQARFVSLRDPASQEILDQALVLYFKQPASETGEDCAEIQCHGAPTVIRQLLDIVASIPGLRLAEPGEFTRRAFLNDKMDLTAVEGLADLVAAETASQRRLAIHQLSGKTAARFERWRESLTLALGLTEALIDFADEEIPVSTVARIDAILDAIRAEITQELADARRGEIIRDGIWLTIIGSVNVGKSSLLNHLAGKQAAIVSHHPGTTRDIIEVSLDIAGFKVILSDTAGLRDTSDPVEQLGIGLSYERAKNSDLILHMVDVSELLQTGLNALDSYRFERFGELQLNLVNKLDLCSAEERSRIESFCRATAAVPMSIRTQQNLDQLWSQLEQTLTRHLQQGHDEPPIITRHRHRDIAEKILTTLGAIEPRMERELMAEELRHAVRLVGMITGKIGVEDLLDVIFSEFCLGK
ncbi:MAG: tRNA uridine-5-carboxymethylaminomethyl(34) synthesis GTPase MnmE [Alphaproteobacteria bacterium]|nr:tRNA uridine-5-carboxymethylaminomethyl(34) synthesis GTPase MnmE [Alphaproteobacteria bacterium]